MNRVPRLSILCSIAFYLVTYYICWRYGAFLRANIWVYKIVLVANFLLPFVIGVFLAKYHIIEQTKKLFRNRTPLLLSLLVLAVFLRCCTNFDAIHIIYSSILVVLLAAIDFPDKFKEIFSMLGKRSTSMWFVHTYFCYYLFRDFIYGFRYPLIIFVVLVAVSYMVSIVVDYINQRVQRTIFA